MDQRDKAPDTGPRHEKQPGKAGATGQLKPGKVEKPRKGSAGLPGTHDPAARAEVPQSEHSEDFGRRRDIENADEPAEQHDRRHHDRNREDAEAGQPV